MKLALILNVINPTLSGVLIRGEKGTAKSTVVRALAGILPEIKMVKGCSFGCNPKVDRELCLSCTALLGSGESLEVENRPIRVVDLPVSATEDRVVGTMDIEKALKSGERHFEAGLLAAAHRNFLYVDEVNLLDDHVVDILLDAAAMGVNIVEREGISYTHASRFVLVGTMNPEEGELRPQLLDRFGLCVTVEGLHEPKDRVAVMERRTRFDEIPETFAQEWESADKTVSEKIISARELLPQIQVEESLLFEVAKNSIAAGVDGHRADIIMLKSAKTLVAFEGRKNVSEEDIGRVRHMVLAHRLRRQPFEDIKS